MFESNYTFHQSGRLGNDTSDQSQKTMQNNTYLNAVLSNYHPETSSNQHIDFATNYPGIMANTSARGNGLGMFSIENESNLLWKSEGQRPLEKLQLYPRSFLTVPYLGRGSCDPTLESQLFQGENVRGKKSVSTVMEQNFMPLDKYPLDDDKRAFANNAKYSVEELALDGWVRGGKSTRDLEENYFSQKSKPSASGL
jgi:hypothetical protein